MICQAYEVLNESASALEHYEKFVALARQLGAHPELTGRFEERARELKLTLTPHFVPASMPKVYTDQSLQAALRERLTYLERLATYPLRSTPEMKRWAERLTQGAKDDMDKAKRLLEALTRRIDPGPGGSRTAREVFTAWDDPEVSFRCQEYARLYVALAREAGLQAFFVRVDQDFKGRTVLHACAGVFVGDKALLVDPKYRWFGVPHEKYEFLDDLQATAFHMSQLGGDILRCRVAVKLLPDFAPAQFNLVLSLLKDGQEVEAIRALQAALRIDPDSWLADYVQGAVVTYFNRWEPAVNFLQKSVASNPDWDKSHFLLAEALRRQSKLKEARAEYRAYLRHQLEPEFTEHALRAIAEINEKLGKESRDSAGSVVMKDEVTEHRQDRRVAKQ